MASSSRSAFMVTATFTTAGVTLAARSEKSRGIASPATAGGAVRSGTITAGAVSAVVSAKAAKMRVFVDFVMVGEPPRLLTRNMGPGPWRPHGRNIECLYSWQPLPPGPAADRRQPVKILLVEDDKHTA